MNRTFFRYSPTIFLTLKNFYNCDCLKDFGQFITYKIQAYTFEIRIIGREKDGDCMYCHFWQDSENSVTLNPRGRGEIDPRFGIGVRVPSRVQNPDLPPRQFEKSFGTKHTEWLSANRWSVRAGTEGEAASLLLMPHQSLRGNLNHENEI